MPRLTVLICTHNRAALLERTLAALNAAARPAGWDVGVLVAANACTDDTHAFLDRYAGGAESRGDLPLAWFPEPTPDVGSTVIHCLSPPKAGMGGPQVTPPSVDLNTSTEVTELRLE